MVSLSTRTLVRVRLCRASGSSGVTSARLGRWPRGAGRGADAAAALARGQSRPSAARRGRTRTPHTARSLLLGGTPRDGASHSAIAFHLRTQPVGRTRVFSKRQAWTIVRSCFTEWALGHYSRNSQVSSMYFSFTIASFVEPFRPQFVTGLP